MIMRTSSRLAAMVALGFMALGAFAGALAATPREMRVDVGSGRATLIVTARIEDYGSAPLDLFAPPVADDSAMLPLQRAASGWVIVSDPSRLRAWPILSSVSTYQALQSR